MLRNLVITLTLLSLPFPVRADEKFSLQKPPSEEKLIAASQKEKNEYLNLAILKRKTAEAHRALDAGARADGSEQGHLLPIAASTLTREKYYEGTELIEKLIKAGAKTIVPYPFLNPPENALVESDNILAAQYLESRLKQPIDYGRNGAFLLHEATRNGSLKAMAYLKSKGVKLDAPSAVLVLGNHEDMPTETPLTTAARVCKTESVFFLLLSGVNASSEALELATKTHNQALKEPTLLSRVAERCALTVRLLKMSRSSLETFARSIKNSGTQYGANSPYKALPNALNAARNPKMR